MERKLIRLTKDVRIGPKSYDIIRANYPETKLYRLTPAGRIRKTEHLSHWDSALHDFVSDGVAHTRHCVVYVLVSRSPFCGEVCAFYFDGRGNDLWSGHVDDNWGWTMKQIKKQFNVTCVI